MISADFCGLVGLAVEIGEGCWAMVGEYEFAISLVFAFDLTIVPTKIPAIIISTKSTTVKIFFIGFTKQNLPTKIWINFAFYF